MEKLIEYLLGETKEETAQWLLDHEWIWLGEHWEGLVEGGVPYAVLAGILVGLYKFLKWGILLLIKRYKFIQLAKDVHPYFSTKEIKDHQQYYIESEYQNIAPSLADEPGKNPHAEISRSNLIDYFLKKAFKPEGDPHRFYLILADSGMGKTTFMINLYLRYKLQIKIAQLFKKDYNIRLFPISAPELQKELEGITDPANTILLLDAFDEDREAAKNYKARLGELINWVKNFREVVITSRTQFFPSQVEEPHDTGVYKYTGGGGTLTFTKLYLSPFSDQDIKSYLKKKFPLFARKKRKRAQDIVSKSPNLMLRPMLLSYIDDLLLSEKDYKYTYEIYEELIARWIDRETQRVPAAEKENFRKKLYQFSRVVAIEIYKRQKREGGEFRIPGEDVFPLAEAHNIELSELELKSRSLLNRDAEGRYKFSHKSILEYFLAKEACEDPDFFSQISFSGMDMVQQFLAEFGFPEMVRVEGGTFEMAKNYPVTLSPYEIGRYPVTRHQWKAIMGNDPSHFKGDEMCPIESISWEDTQEFIQKLNQLTGQTYRLLTEAEWEFAARGGIKSKGYEYAGSNDLDEVGWYINNSKRQPQPVGQKQPNELGLYDMSGNVWEWCHDWYGDYPSEPQTDPQEPESGNYRVIRGGSWSLIASDCRVAYRDGLPSFRYDLVGFRLARTVNF